MLPPKDFYSPVEVAEHFAVHQRVILRMCNSGALPAARVSIFWRIPAASVAQLAQAHQPSTPLGKVVVPALEPAAAEAMAAAAEADTAAELRNGVECGVGDVDSVIAGGAAE